MSPNYGNWIVRRNGQNSYFYSYGTNHAFFPMIQGSEKTLHFIEGEFDADKIFNNLCADEGLLIDCDRQVLLFWESCDFPIEEPTLIPHLVNMMSRTTWSGWDVRWAYFGQTTLAEYLGLSISSVSKSPPEINKKKTTWYHIKWWLEFDRDDERETLIIHRHLDGNIKRYKTSHYVDGTFSLGEELISLLNVLPETWLPREIDISGCFYIDEITHTLYVWSGYAFFNEFTMQDIQSYWWGWQVIWLERGYAELINKISDDPQRLLISSEEAVSKIADYCREHCRYQIRRRINFHHNHGQNFKPQLIEVLIRDLETVNQLEAKWLKSLI